MIAWLVAALARRNVSERLRKPLACAALVVGFLALCGLLWGAWTLWLHFHDKGVVTHHEEKVAVQVTTKTLHADRQAGAKKAARDRVEQRKQTELQEKANEAYQSGSDPLDAVWSGLWSPDVTSGVDGPGEASGLSANP